MDPISMDLRLRILHALDDRASVQEIIEQFGVSRSTVQRVRQRWTSGRVGPLPHGGGNPGVIDLYGRELLQRLVWQQPDRDFPALAELYNALRGTTVSRETVRRHVYALGFTRKKSRSTAASNTAPTSSPRESPSRTSSRISTRRR